MRVYIPVSVMIAETVTEATTASLPDINSKSILCDPAPSPEMTRGKES